MGSDRDGAWFDEDGTLHRASPIDDTFSFSSVPPGAFLVSSVLRSAAAMSGLRPPAWMLKSISFNGRDLLDAPLDIRPGTDVTGLVVTYTDRVTQITGLVTDRSGRPAPTYSVIVFGTDSRYWARGSRWVRQPVRPANDGRFAINALPPGEYYLAVLFQFDPNEWFTPAFLQQVVPGAVAGAGGVHWLGAVGVGRAGGVRVSLG